MGLATDETPVGHLVIPPTIAAPPVGSRAASPTTRTVPLRTFPYGLHTASQQYASSVSTNLSAYEELSGHHLRSALDLVASTTASEYRDSAKSPGTEHRVITPSRHDGRN
jgi:hypothetical protein